MTTKDRLAADLEAAGAPGGMVERARRGHYDDFESPLSLPIVALVRACNEAGLIDIAERAKDGAYDATPEEAQAWWEREGRLLLDEHAAP